MVLRRAHVLINIFTYFSANRGRVVDIPQMSVHVLGVFKPFKSYRTL